MHTKTKWKGKHTCAHTHTYRLNMKSLYSHCYSLNVSLSGCPLQFSEYSHSLYPLLLFFSLFISFFLPVKHTFTINLFYIATCYSSHPNLNRKTNPFFLYPSEWTCRYILSELCLVFTSLGLGVEKGVGTMGLTVKHQPASGCPLPCLLVFVLLFGLSLQDCAPCALSLTNTEKGYSFVDGKFSLAIMATAVSIHLWMHSASQSD